MMMSDYRFQKFVPGKATGTFSSKFSTAVLLDTEFYNPNGIARDSSGNIYVTDGNNNRVLKFSSSGTPLMKFGST